MRYCGKCGAQVSEKALYCEMCAGKLVETQEIKTQDSPPATNNKPAQDKPEIEELDLTALDKDAAGDKNIQNDTNKNNIDTPQPTAGVDQDKPKHGENIININEILESEDKVEIDNSIKREVLADDEELSKVCPMCGEGMQLNKKLLENVPVMVKCLKCGNETKIW